MPQVVPVRARDLARLALVIVPFLFSFCVYSQTASTPPAAAGPGASIANPLEVTVELAVHDKKGNTVPDLTPADVEITDAGVPVSLTGLRLAGQTQETILFIFDQVVPGVGKTQRDLAEQLLAAVSGHGYYFAVFKIEKRLHLLQAQTTDADAVRNAIVAATMAKRPDYIKATEAAEKQMTEDIDSATGVRQATAKMLLAMMMDSQKTADSDAQATPSVAALLAVARGQRGVPGRKAVLYFSQGLDWNKSSPELLRDIRDAANREHASLYSFDSEIGDTNAANTMVAGAAVRTGQAMGGVASGSITPTMGSTGTAEGIGTGSQAAEYAGRLSSGEAAANSPRSLEAICRSTGGARVDAGDGKRAVAEIAVNLNSYYLASWISPSPGDESKLRPITVKSLRKGVLVSSRLGYYPLRGGNVATVSGAEAKLLAALSAPELPAALPLSAALLRYGNTPDNDVNSVLVQVPVDKVELKDGQGSVSVLAQLKNPSGAVVEKFSADIASRPAAGDAQAARDVVSFRRQFSAPPGEYVLESSALDANSGKIGAQRSNVVIPAVAKGLALGDVLLVGRIDPPSGPDASDPLRCSKGTVVPNLSGHISKSATPKIDLFFNLHLDSGSTDAPTLSAELRHDDALVGKLPLKLPAADPNRQTIPYLTTLGAGSLSAGEYEMTIILSQGGQTVSRTVSFALD